MSKSYPLVSLHDISVMDAGSTLILSVNNRYARRIVTDLSALLGESQQVMAVPDIVPLGAWLIQVADHLSFHAEQDIPSYAADNFGALYLWRRVITDTESDQTLLDTTQAARLASEADRLLDDWRITVRPEEETADFQRFTTWRTHYRARLSQLDIEDTNLAYERICRAVSQGDLHLPLKNIVLAGFNDISPRLAQLLDAMQSQGTMLFSLEQTALQADQVRRRCAADSDTEWRLAAQWACEQLEGRPDGRYAIVAPKIEGSVPVAYRVLHQTLGHRGFAFNIGVGRPLSEWPLVRAALSWLRVVAAYAQGRSCSAADIGQALLAGGCIAHHAESSARALLDARLRKRAVIDVRHDQFEGMLAEYAPALSSAWTTIMTGDFVPATSQSLAVWADTLRGVLQGLGFPGDGSLGSHAYQTLDAFDELLDRLAGLTPVTGRLGMSAVVAVLSQLASDTVFQPQRDPNSRLDVLGFLEAEGGRWDGVWVLGLTDDVLPALPQPNPFIPLSALRRVNAPRATPERELEWAQTIYKSLLSSAPRVWLSHPEQEGERLLRPSPCIIPWPVCDAELRPVSRPVWQFDCIVDDQGPPLVMSDPVRGGIAVIDAQARNPLWAFARFRLGASLLPDYATLSDQSVRGQFLHRSMELLWRVASCQDTLHDLLQNGRLDTLIEQVTLQAGDEWLTDFSATLRQLEIHRAQGILTRWLELEMQRDQFDVVAVEQCETWTHGSLELSLQLDRVDRLADGRLAVIDYKSGATAVDPRRNWMRERPVDLQLPFYAAVLNKQDPGVAALIMAYLHARRTDAVGVSDGDCGLSGVSHFTSWAAFDGLSWDQVLQRWQNAIKGMADEFARGYAANQIVDSNDLAFCEVEPFLRLTEEYPGDS